MLSSSTSEVEVASRRIKGARLFAILLFGVAFVAEGSDSKTLLSDSAKAVTARQATMAEFRRDSENLRSLLQGNASMEEKRKAIDVFRAKREALRSEMLAGIPEQTAEEKAIARQRIKESIRRLPEERRKVVEERLAITEEMEKLRSEEKRLSPEERRTRVLALMDRRRKLMEAQMVAMEAAAASEAKDKPKIHKSPFLQTIEAERRKLDAALANGDPEARRAAMEGFREAIAKARHARQQEMEQRLKFAVPPPSQPRQPSIPWM